MDKFYYDLLNLTPITKEQFFKKVKEAIEAEADIYRDDNPNLERLCKIVAHNINMNLKDRHIDSRVVNTSELYDMYEHHFIISSYVDNGEVKYVLIDPTFTQFRPKQNDFDTIYPVNILLETKEGTKLAFNLIKHGYSEINDEDLQRYIAAIKLEKDISNTDITIDDIILERRHK